MTQYGQMFYRRSRQPSLKKTRASCGLPKRSDLSHFSKRLFVDPCVSVLLTLIASLYGLFSLPGEEFFRCCDSFPVFYEYKRFSFVQWSAAFISCEGCRWNDQPRWPWSFRTRSSVAFAKFRVYLSGFSTACRLPGNIFLQKKKSGFWIELNEEVSLTVPIFQQILPIYIY